jgi:hypothetical protein
MPVLETVKEVLGGLAGGVGFFVLNAFVMQSKRLFVGSKQLDFTLKAVTCGADSGEDAEVEPEAEGAEA